LLSSLFLAVPSFALTVEEIIALKKAGVSEETIQMLLEREEKAMEIRAGTWKLRDGRTVYSNEGAAPPAPQYGPEAYPLCIYPTIDVPQTKPKKAPK
jgi:hypothetical protein